MRVFLATVAGCLLATTAFGAQARALSQNDRTVCGWGSQIAAEAQQAKLSGVTLYATRKKLQVRRFAVTVRPTHLPDPDAKGDGVHLI